MKSDVEGMGGSGGWYPAQGYPPYYLGGLAGLTGGQGEDSALSTSPDSTTAVWPPQPHSASATPFPDSTTTPVSPTHQVTLHCLIGIDQGITGRLC